jgi:uncharacterized protein (DUF58 family)
LALAFDPARPCEGVPFVGVATVEGAAANSGRVQLRIGELAVEASLRRERDAVRVGTFVVPALPRGVHAVRNGELPQIDPLGFARIDRALAGSASVIVWPRWLEPEETPGGAVGDGEFGASARRPQPVGYDLHGIREHQQGESLRRVDWKTSARTGRLMVRELEDASRADLTIMVDLDRALLDGDGADALMRATATVVRGAVARGQQASLLLVGSATLRIALDGAGASWFAAMDALAAAVADRELPLAAAILRDRALLAGGSLLVLTASSAPELAALLVREAAQMPVQVVRIGQGDGEASWDDLEGTPVKVLDAHDNGVVGAVVPA